MRGLNSAEVWGSLRLEWRGEFGLVTMSRHQMRSCARSILFLVTKTWEPFDNKIRYLSFGRRPSSRYPRTLVLENRDGSFADSKSLICPMIGIAKYVFYVFYAFAIESLRIKSFASNKVLRRVLYRNTGKVSPYVNYPTGDRRDIISRNSFAF